MALIDWEIWGLGDPRADIAWLSLYVEKATFPGFDCVHHMCHVRTPDL